MKARKGAVRSSGGSWLICFNETGPMKARKATLTPVTVDSAGMLQ